MTSHTILISEPTEHTDYLCSLFGPSYNFIIGPFTRDNFLDSLSRSTAAFVRLSHQIDKDAISKSPQLSVIATPTTGLNHIDTVAAQNANISIISLRPATDLLRELPATAELTWALLLAVRRKLFLATSHTYHGNWDRDLFWGNELAQKTIGIIGYGRIGQMIAKYALAFGMTVIYHDILKLISPVAGVRQVNLETLLSTSDVISIHVPFNQGDKPILGHREFLQVKRGSLLINTSRGEVLNEDALISSLLSGSIAGAGLDVLSNEPHVNSKLLRMQHTHNVVITPHIGGATYESIQKTEYYIAKQLHSFLEPVSLV